MWIAEQGAPATALEYVRRIRTFVANLAELPERGTSYGAVRAGLRVVGFERRVVIAFVVRETHVEVERVFYGGRNWRKALRLPED